MKRLVIAFVAMLALSCAAPWHRLPPPPKEPAIVFAYDDDYPELVVMGKENLLEYLDYVEKLKAQNNELRARLGEETGK